MNITIIGGSGFVGSRLATRLVASGHTVRIADKRSSQVHPTLHVHCDIRDTSALERELEGSDVVINLAAEHRDDVSPKSLYDEVNVTGSRNLCQVCTKLGIKRIVFTSSVAVYGFAPVGTDESGKINYFNDYGRTKWLAEQEYRQWLNSDSRNSVVIIRPTVIFGEGNRGNVYNLLRQIAGGRFPMVGKGTNRKSMNYVENVAAFIQHCVEEVLPAYELSDVDSVRGPSEPQREYLYNYCDQPAYDMNGLVLEVYKALGKPKTKLLHWPYPLAYFGGLCFDLLAFILRKRLPISSIRVRKFCQNTYFTSARIDATGFVPPVSLPDGLHATIRHEFVDRVPGIVFHTE